MFFFDQPEFLRSINLIPGFVYKNWPITLLFGGGFLVIVFGVFVFMKMRRGFFAGRFLPIFLGLCVIFWAPLYIVFFYNNVYDFAENFDYHQFSNSSKSMLRLCRIDDRQDLGGFLCRTSSFSTFVRKNIPEGSTVKLAALSGIAPYIYYNLYPFVKFTHSFERADFILFYYADSYFYRDGKLYEIGRDNAGRPIITGEVGDYEVVSAMDSGRLILKKRENL